MGTDSGNSPQASGGLARSSSKLNLAKGSALGRSSSKVGLAGMVGSAAKTGLRRSPSRGQLSPSQPENASPSANAASHVSGSKSTEALQEAPRQDVRPAAPASAVPPVSSTLPVLKRSHSMDHIDTVKAPVVSEGQKAVESITGKIALPSVSVPAMEGSMVPANIPDHEVSERGQVITDHQLAEQASALEADLSPSPYSTQTSSNANSSTVSPSPSSSSVAPRDQGSVDHHDTHSPNQVSGDSASGGSAKSLTALQLLHRPDVPSPRDDAAALPEAEQRVDYFSHDWNESDIAGSWRYIISRRQDMANSARLENASWRMWAKAKNGLSTVPPSTVNWLKDYDVTWLYGPLYHEPDNVYEGSEVPRQSRHGSVSPNDGYHTNPMESVPQVSKHGCYPKSILKKKTLAQLMVEEAHELEQNTSVPGRSTTNYIRHHHYRPTPLGANRQMVADILNQQYASMPSRTGPVATPAGSDPNSASASAQESEAGSRSPTPGATPSRRPRSLRSMRSNRSGSLASISTLERHVHFNDRVEQCVALDPEDEDEKSKSSRPENVTPDSPSDLTDEAAAEDDDDEDDEDDDEDDAGLFLGLRRPSVIDIKAHENGCNIIASLPATTLKYEDDVDEEADSQRKEEVVSSMLTSSRRPGFNAHYQPHPVQTQNGPSYQIVDPTIHPVDFKAGNDTSDLAEPTRTKVRPAASFG